MLLRRWVLALASYRSGALSTLPVGEFQVPAAYWVRNGWYQDPGQARKWQQAVAGHCIPRLRFLQMEFGWPRVVATKLPFGECPNVQQLGPGTLWISKPIRNWSTNISRVQCIHDKHIWVYKCMCFCLVDMRIYICTYRSSHAVTGWSQPPGRRVGGILHSRGRRSRLGDG